MHIFPISADGNFFLPVAQAQKLGVILNYSLFYSTYISCWSPIGSTFKIYPKPDHFSPPSLILPGSMHHHLLPGLQHVLLTSFPPDLSQHNSQGSSFKTYVRSCHSSAQKPPVALHFREKPTSFQRPSRSHTTWLLVNFLTPSPTPLPVAHPIPAMLPGLLLASVTWVF